LNLPDIDKKRIAEQESIKATRTWVISERNTPRLAKKRSVIEKIKRSRHI